MAQDVAALEVFEHILAVDFPVDEESLSLEAFREIGPGGTFLGAKHTLRHFRESIAGQGAGTVTAKDLLDRYEDPGIDAAVDEALKAFVAKRKEEIERAAG